MMMEPWRIEKLFIRRLIRCCCWHGNRAIFIIDRSCVITIALRGLRITILSRRGFDKNKRLFGDSFIFYSQTTDRPTDRELLLWSGDEEISILKKE